MRCSISEAARRTGVSVRTLRYYDEIGLLKPSEVSPAGYRYYDAQAMETLQQILFYRELGVDLAQIGRILRAPDNDRTEALQKHRRLLLLKRQRLDDMLRLVDETIGGNPMMYNEKPRPTQAELDAVREEYAREAAERWGNTEAFFESQEKHKHYTPEQEAQIKEEMEDIFRAFGQCGDPAGAEAQELARRWQAHITKYHYNCTKSIFTCLGDMYVNDPQFRENLDQYGPGTAQRIHDAIKIYCQ